MTIRFSISSLAAILSLAVPAVAAAHARLDYPPGRDMRDDHKDTNGGAPCGIARAASQSSTPLTPGASVEVKWTETVNHPGCFLIDFSSSGDTNFQMLGMVKHVATGNTPRAWTKTVTLPAAPCTACTLRVRQIMLANETAACPPATIASGASYYACGNVVVSGAGGGAPPPPADAGTDAAKDGGPSSGGATGSGGGSATGGATTPPGGGVSGSGGYTSIYSTGGAGTGGAGTGGRPAGGSGGAAPGGTSDSGGGCSAAGPLPTNGPALGISAILLALAFGRWRGPRLHRNRAGQRRP
ncbi:MAG: SCE4755 family polysaccharide monooxygenase-like protein [Myxococcales bacterium]